MYSNEALRGYIKDRAIPPGSACSGRKFRNPRPYLGDDINMSYGIQRLMELKKRDRLRESALLRYSNKALRAGTDWDRAVSPAGSDCSDRTGYPNPQPQPRGNISMYRMWLYGIQRLKELEKRDRLRESALTLSTTTMSTAMNDSEVEYYYFWVKESVDSEPGVDNVITCPGNSDLEKLRTELWEQFDVPRDRRIFYINDDGFDVPLDSKSEFDDASRLAKDAVVGNAAIPYLIVGSYRITILRRLQAAVEQRRR